VGILKHSMEIMLSLESALRSVSKHCVHNHYLIFNHKSHLFEQAVRATVTLSIIVLALFTPERKR